ncbi:uncharacterized protein B0P05DRAFT_583915 [Gilbertella persicaria]|uniref:uncharacterized protein n=1 Tax=Gilbertella persicaria TaxID=101096 RepID=UPI00221F2394|nr:uncharacterized protein B0P05DRAFT_583915 [Gilbertella persicaria]KAI8091403.1 hypothetical protein B0P05DRAFT_583915 [Gilbertella persicaria]
MRIALLFVSLVFFTLLSYATADTYAFKYGFKQKTAQDFMLPRKVRSSSPWLLFFTDWLHDLPSVFALTCMKITYYFVLLYNALHDVYLSQLRLPTLYAPIDPIYHQRNISAIIYQLETQRHEARLVHKKWVQDSFEIHDILVNFVQNQLNEWQHLMTQWNTTHHINQAFLEYDWKMANQSLRQLYRTGYYSTLQLKPRLSHVPLRIEPYNQALFQQLMAYLHQLHQIQIDQTKHVLVRHLNFVRHDTYLQLYHSFLARKQGKSYALHHVTLSPFVLTRLNKIWKEDPEKTVPYYFLKKATPLQLIWFLVKFIWTWVIDYICVCLGSYHQMEREKLLHQLDMSIENLVHFE